MNEILKFKEGRKILKGLYGLKPHEVLGGRVNGEIVAYVNIPGKGYLAVDGKGNAYRTVNEGRNGEYYRKTQFEPVNLTDYDRQHIYKAATRDGGMTSFGLAQASRVADYWASQGAPKPVTKSVAKPAAKPADKPTATPADTKQDAVVSAPVTTGRSTRPDYTAKFNGMNFTDDEKKYMTDAGFDPTNAKSVQEFILSKASNANLGARRGAGIADGYWGDKSVAAFQALRNQGIFTPKVDEQEKPALAVELPVDAPDFGYKTSNHYGDGMALKGLGFNNYAGLQAYAKTSTDLFAQDLRKRFGDDVSAWDQAAVEGGLGVSGKYRGGRSGDFGDMARSMADWAGKTNAAYDLRELASRTDSNGVVHDNAKLALLFNKADASLKFANANKYKLNLPDWNFNLKQGNVGANSLGDQPGLSKEWAGTDGIA